MTARLRQLWWRFLAQVWRPRTAAETVGDLVVQGRAQLHLVEPGGVLIISGVNPDDQAQVRRVEEALRQIPRIHWLALPHAVAPDVLSPALRALMIHQLTEQLGTADGGFMRFGVRDLADRMIEVLCPRCTQRIQMSIMVTLSDCHDHLVAKAIVDPADVDLHNLSCNGS